VSKPTILFLGAMALIAIVAALVTWRDYRRIAVWRRKRTAFEDALDLRERAVEKRLKSKG
jgi:hypothetical protein